MQSGDRPEFEEQLAVLCAGFNVPATPHRKHAYFAGLAKMSLAQFVRCVEFALSDDGPEELPTTKGIWRLYRRLRAPRAPLNVPRIEEKDHLLFFANRLFFRHLMNRGGLGSMGRFVPGYGLVDCHASQELSRARVALRDTVEWFAGPIREADPDATPHAFVTSLIKALEKISPIDRRTLDGWAAMIAHPDALKPFEPHMGRELPAEYGCAAQPDLLSL